MRVCDGQNLGALSIMIVSLAIYGGALLHDRKASTELSLPWGKQGPGVMATEVVGSGDADGIYFFPEGMSIANILKVVNIKGANDATAFSAVGRAAITVSREGEAVTISDMPALRRLALGLPVDVNRASVEDLSLIPGVGEKMAAEIVRRRQMVGRFTMLSDLTDVPGIKGKKLNALKKHLEIGSTHYR